MNFRRLYETSGMSQKVFAEYFGIPLRTIENWATGKRKCPEYLLELMRYKLEHEGLIPIRPAPIKRAKTVLVLDGRDT